MLTAFAKIKPSKSLWKVNKSAIVICIHMNAFFFNRWVYGMYNIEIKVKRVLKKSWVWTCNNYRVLYSWLHNTMAKFKVILCASEHICSIERYCFKSFKQLQKDPLHVLTDANVLVLIDTDQSIFVNGSFSLPSDIHRPIIFP